MSSHPPSPLADPAWVAAHLGDPAVRIIDCSDAAEYARAHVPGAAPLGLHPWLKEEHSPHVLNPQAFARRMGDLGVSARATVVAYDGGTGWLAARLWWVLRLYGHGRARVLNGGWRAWVRGGQPVSVDTPASDPAAFEARPRPHLLIRAAELRSLLGRKDVHIVNLLPPAQFRGEANPFGNARTGHLPGSVNLPNECFSGEGGVLESAQAVQAALQAAQLSPASDTILHCQAGVRSAHACLALTVAGWTRVRVYDASLAEWANRDDLPLAQSGDFTPGSGSRT